MRPTNKLISVAFVAGLAVVAAPFAATATPLTQAYGATKSAAVATKSDPAPPSDKTLTSRIEKRLKADAVLKKFDIDVSVSASVATLTGAVRTEAERTRAARDAKVAGVTRVDNQLKVDKDAGKGLGEKTKAAAETAGEKTKAAAETIGEKTKEGVSKTGEVITDTWITTKVKSQFMGEDALKGSDINVDTDKHIVTLRGTVKSEAGRARATQIAKSTDGVQRVVDRLTIK
jgi:hyperosmotically inducible protein